MKVRYFLLFAVLLVLTGWLAPKLWPKTEIVVGPPAKPDTIFVAELKTDTLWQTRTMFSTDTVNLVETVVIADTVFVPIGTVVPIRKYVTEVSVGEQLGDSTWIAGESFAADSAGMRFVPFAQAVWTAGPLRGLRTEGDVLRVDFGEYPAAKSCTFWDKAGAFTTGFGAGGIVGVIVGKVF